MKRFIFLFVCLAQAGLQGCECLDNEIEEGTFVTLEEVARIFSEIPLAEGQLAEVHDAVMSSSEYGYDEEYTMMNLFTSPGTGVGEDVFASSRSAARYERPLSMLVREYLESRLDTKSAAVAGPDVSADEYIEALQASDIQIYWPFSDNWDGVTMPVITFDPEDGGSTNIGFRISESGDGARIVETVLVDEEMAEKVPVWVINRNDDRDYTSLEVLRRMDPDWGQEGGSLVVRPQNMKSVPEDDDEPLQTLILKDFTMNRHYDSWFAGASEFFVKIGAIEDFTASTEAELQLYNPSVTDFMIVVKRNQKGIPQPFNAVLVSDWTEQLTHCAFMIIEDDGGTRTSWKCSALVRIASKSYGIEIDLPFRTRDDIVWRGQLSRRYITQTNNMVGHYGDVDMTFELIGYR